MDRTADAEQAKQSGGMIALWPDDKTKRNLVVPGGEPADDLHLTLVYLGEDVSGLSSLGAQAALDDLAMWTERVEARAFAHATFNPDGLYDPCAVYLIGNAPGLQDLQGELSVEIGARYNIGEQHTPWIPHVTAGYGKTAADLTYTGEVVFDRIALSWMGEEFSYPLS